MTTAVRETLSTAATLLLFSLVCAALLATAYLATRPDIERSEQAQKLALLAQTLPHGSFDNDPIAQARPLPVDPLLGLKRPGLAYLATHSGKPVAIVLEAAAPDGYAGEIRLLIGIDAAGVVTGVRVTAHHETPGLGDYIDIAKHAWIGQFVGRKLDAGTPDSAWKVRKDGGQFDYLAGATVTPRAVVKAVHAALRYFALHREDLLHSHGGQKAGVTAPRSSAARVG